jgi:segregation and condensation protein A
MIFRVDLDLFRGPLDLLLYLVRKHEVDLTQLPVAPITEQFLAYLAVLEHIDVNAVGDFLEMASTLIEIKSKLLLPRADEDDELAEPLEDPRAQLVEQLLEYKQYRDAACILEDRSRDWSQCYTRLADDLPPRRIDPAEQPIREVELWDLVSALGRVLRTHQVAQPTSIVYDETPIQTYMLRIHQRLCEDGQVAFTDMFHANMHKSAMIGVFLAILELVRHHSVVAEQDDLHSEIYLIPGQTFENTLAINDVDEYQGTTKPR